MLPLSEEDRSLFLRIMAYRKHKPWCGSPFDWYKCDCGLHELINKIFERINFANSESGSKKHSEIDR